MKKRFSMKVAVYYNGKLSKKDEIGHLIVEFSVNEKINPLVKSYCSYVIEGERNIVPVNINKIHCIECKIVDTKNIHNGYNDAFNYKCEEGVITFVIRGIHAFVHFGSPKLLQK